MDIRLITKESTSLYQILLWPSHILIITYASVLSNLPGQQRKCVCMLTANNNSALDHKKVDQELKFFYQRWQELLDPRTLDMYQYNILNSCIACLELQDTIEKTLSGLLLSRQNVDDIKDEALLILKDDDILFKYDKPLWITLMRILSSKLGKKKTDELSDDNEKDSFHVSLLRLKHQLSGHCRSLRRNYAEKVVQEIKEDINQQNKTSLEKHLVVLISQCIYDGWSTKGLFDLATILEGTNSTEQKINTFFATILSTNITNFEVYYSIKIETRPELGSEAIRQTIRDLGINLKKGSEIINTDPNRQILYSSLDAEKYYTITILNSHDYLSAALVSINSLQNKLSIATFYNIINPFIANAPTIIVFNCQNHDSIPLKITDVFRTYDYVDSSNSVFEDTKNIFNDPEKSEIMDKLSSVFLYTNLSRSSYFQETKFITLWIALESIMRTGQYPDIISHVKKILPSALCVRYFYKILRNFCEDCIRCNVRYLDNPINLDLRSDDKKHIVTTMIAIFRNPTFYALLLQRCELNDLLHFRCEQIHDVLNDTVKMQNKIKHYKIKIEWHIQRLYRIRNEITHSAFKNDRSLIIYIEHLYSYLSQLISEIVFYIEHKNVKSIEEAYALLENNYYTFMDIMESKTLAVEETLPNGIMSII